MPEQYVYESSEDVDTKTRTIIKTSAAEERFTIKQLEEKIARIEEQKASLDLDIAKIQEKIDEATEALAIVTPIK